MKHLRINDEILFYGREYRIVAKDGINVTIMSLWDMKTIEISMQQLVSDPTFDDKESIIEYKGTGKYKSILSSLNEKDFKTVSERFEKIIRPIITLEKAKYNDYDLLDIYAEYLEKYIRENETLKDITQEMLIERISLSVNKSVRTIKRYLKGFRDVESNNLGFGQEGLVPKKNNGYEYRNDNKLIEICYPKSKEIMFTINTRLDAIYVPIIKDAIEKVYLTKMKNSNMAVWDAIDVQCVKLGIETPKPITIFKLINRIDNKVKDLTRESKKIGERHLDIDRGYTNKEAMYPLHIVAIDHTPLDVEIIDNVTGYPMGKPWLTVGIDLFSRCVWCMYLSFEPPSINRTRKALQHGMFFKFVKEKYNLKNEWEVFGFPDNIMFDNGVDFKSYDIERTVTEIMRSNVMYRPVRTPRYGGVIERYFGTIDDKLIHRLAGTTKSNYHELGDYEPEKEALLTLENVNELLTRYIVEEYHFTKHLGLPLNSNIPMLRYKEFYNDRGYVPKFEEEKYKIELMPQVERSYTRDGIRFENRRYKSTELSYLIGPREKKYKIKYDPDDISKVYLLLPSSTEFVEVLAVEPPYEVLKGVNAYAYKRILEELINEGIEKSRDIPAVQNVRMAKLKRQEVYEVAIKNNKRLLKQSKLENVELTATFPIKEKYESRNTDLEPTLDELFKKAESKANQQNNNL
jgi:hypothetical protein